MEKYTLYTVNYSYRNKTISEHSFMSMPGLMRPMTISVVGNSFAEVLIKVQDSLTAQVNDTKARLGSWAINSLTIEKEVWL